MKLHETDGLSLGFGLVFLGIAGLWVVSRAVTLSPAMVGWLVAGGLVLLGGLGIAHTAVNGRRGADDRDPDRP